MRFSTPAHHAEEALGRYFLTNVLVEFHLKFPRVRVNVELLNCRDAHGLLAANRTDLVFAEKPAADGRFEFFPLFTDCFHIIVSPSHRWTIKGSVTLSELATAPFILHRNLGESQKMVTEYFERNDMVLNGKRVLVKRTEPSTCVGLGRRISIG
jgi:DNA-binding transcriptional LysR family regulator